jgi:hypothetical protein
MFPYDYVLSNDMKKNSNQSSDCTVHNTDSLFSSCLFTFTFYYVLPLSIIGICYSRVVFHVRRSGDKVSKQLVSHFISLLN